MPFSTKNFHAKTLTASIISVITEDIYLKLRIVVTIKRGTHKVGEIILHFFFKSYAPFFT